MKITNWELPPLMAGFAVSQAARETACSEDGPKIPLMPGERILREVVAKHYINAIDLKSVRRVKHLVIARQEAAYRLATETRMSYPQIGRMLSRDHTTIIHAVRAHANRNGLPNPVPYREPRGDALAPFWTDSLVQRAVALRQAGMDWDRIAETIGARSARAVYCRLRRDKERNTVNCGNSGL